MLQNFFSAKNFDFSIQRLPNVEFFVQSVNLPGLNLPVTDQTTPFANIPRPGSKLQFDDFSVTVRLDENLVCYKEVYNWVTGMTNPNNFSQYTTLQANGGIFSDASLIILNSKGNPKVAFNFKGIFPIGISSIQLNTTNSTTEYATATITFKYTTFEIVDL